MLIWQRPALPSALATLIRNDELELALVPQVEACRREEYRILPGHCISCDGEVGSILLFGEKNWEDIQKVAVDHASNSSVQLLSVLRHIDGLSPLDLSVGPSNLSILEHDSEVDSVLLIGDAALENARLPISRLDLGAMWKKRTGLPFVFAVWLARTVLPGWVTDSITAAAENGLADREGIAERYCQQNPGVLDVPSALHYLHENIRYTLGDSQIEALKLFHRLRCELDATLNPEWSPLFLEPHEKGE